MNPVTESIFLTKLFSFSTRAAVVGGENVLMPTLPLTADLNKFSLGSLAYVRHAFSSLSSHNGQAEHGWPHQTCCCCAA